jgi:quinone-modifying oxidoreductase subunit QmoC
MVDEYIKPDIEFIRDVRRSGGDTLKKCYQCATCSVTCPQSTDSNPFPRKEMIWAQWGLKDRLTKSPAVWVCHYCGDCTAHCPRGAKPGEVLNALRQFSIGSYSSPKFLTNLVGKKSFLPVLFGIPTLIFLSYILLQGGFPDTEKIVFANLFPQIGFIDPLFIALAVFVLLSAGSGSLKMWKDMNEMFPPVEKKSLIGSVLSTFISIFKHSKFNECLVNKNRFLAHLFTFYGFVFLFITTMIISVLEWAGLLGIHLPVHHNEISEPYTILGLKIASSVTPLDNILFKLLANFGAVILLLGITLVIKNRLTGDEESKGSYFDWLLILVIVGVGLTGFLTELIRLAGSAVPAYSMYTLHLIFVFVLFAYLPFSKLAHLFYRTVALIYLGYSGRAEPIVVEEKAIEAEEAPEPEEEGEAGEEAPAEGEAKEEEPAKEAEEEKPKDTTTPPPPPTPGVPPPPSPPPSAPPAGDGPKEEEEKPKDSGTPPPPPVPGVPPPPS